LLAGRLNSTFLTKVHFLHVINEKKIISKSQPGRVDDRRLRVPLRNTGDHPTSFLGAVPTYKLLDLPKINGGALGTPALPSGLGGIPALPSPLLLGG
jgi:hypothetical protein